MTISKHVNNHQLEIKLSGRLDTITSPELEAELKQSLDQITDLSFDFSDLEYISSAGLRVLLATQKVMNKQGEMVIYHVNDMVKEVFEVTGFIDILTIK